jgi:hypothetical protein
MERFFVKAGSVNAVRKALHRAPGGARVIGRFDRETIECRHTMSDQSITRHWPVLLSRLEKAGLVVVDRPRTSGSTVEEEVSQTSE